MPLLTPTKAFIGYLPISFKEAILGTYKVAFIDNYIGTMGPMGLYKRESV